jgi:carbon-monoxide dehydrogenase medium subunit
METEIRPLSEFDYFAPDSLPGALELIKAHGDKADVLAGGTDLLVWMKKRTASPATIVDINRIRDLSFIEVRDDHLHIGALTRLNVIKESSMVQQKAPLLAEAIGFLASHPIRNRATIGGNLCSASPAADTAPPLLALNASVILESPEGKRAVALSEFFTGPGQTIRKRDEVLKELKIPCREGRWAFLKLGRRKGFTLSIASAAAFGVIRDGKFEDIDVAVGAVAPIPIRSQKIREALKGSQISMEGIEKASKLIQNEVNPITDVRASAAYRREMVSLLTKRVLKKVALGEEYSK